MHSLATAIARQHGAAPIGASSPHHQLDNLATHIGPFSNERDDEAHRSNSSYFGVGPTSTQTLMRRLTDPIQRDSAIADLRNLQHHLGANPEFQRDITNAINRAMSFGPSGAPAQEPPSPTRPPLPHTSISNSRPTAAQFFSNSNSHTQPLHQQPATPSRSTPARRYPVQQPRVSRARTRPDLVDEQDDYDDDLPEPDEAAEQEDDDGEVQLNLGNEPPVDERAAAARRTHESVAHVDRQVAAPPRESHSTRTRQPRTSTTARPTTSRTLTTRDQTTSQQPLSTRDEEALARQMEQSGEHRGRGRTRMASQYRAQGIDSAAASGYMHNVSPRADEAPYTTMDDAGDDGESLGEEDSVTPEPTPPAATHTTTGTRVTIAEPTSSRRPQDSSTPSHKRARPSRRAAQRGTDVSEHKEREEKSQPLHAAVRNRDTTLDNFQAEDHEDFTGDATGDHELVDQMDEDDIEFVTPHHTEDVRKEQREIERKARRDMRKERKEARKIQRRVTQTLDESADARVLPEPSPLPLRHTRAATAAAAAPSSFSPPLTASERKAARAAKTTELRLAMQASADALNAHVQRGTAHSAGAKPSGHARSGKKDKSDKKAKHDKKKHKKSYSDTGSKSNHKSALEEWEDSDPSDYTSSSSDDSTSTSTSNSTSSSPSSSSSSSSSPSPSSGDDDDGGLSEGETSEEDSPKQKKSHKKKPHKSHKKSHKSHHSSKSKSHVYDIKRRPDQTVHLEGLPSVQYYLRQINGITLTLDLPHENAYHNKKEYHDFDFKDRKRERPIVHNNTIQPYQQIGGETAEDYIRVFNGQLGPITSHFQPWPWKAALMLFLQSISVSTGSQLGKACADILKLVTTQPIVSHHLCLNAYLIAMKCFITHCRPTSAQLSSSKQDLDNWKYHNSTQWDQWMSPWEKLYNQSYNGLTDQRHKIDLLVAAQPEFFKRQWNLHLATIPNQPTFQSASNFFAAQSRLQIPREFQTQIDSAHRNHLEYQAEVNQHLPTSLYTPSLSEHSSARQLPRIKNGDTPLAKMEQMVEAEREILKQRKAHRDTNRETSPR